MSEHTAENGAPDEWVPWECPRCGKTAQANLTRLGPLGVVRCTCGSTSRATRPIPPEGWLPFGSLIDYDGPAECSDETGEDGLPLWERPIPPGESP